MTTLLYVFDAGWRDHLQGTGSLKELLMKYQRVGGPLGHHRDWVKNSGIEKTRPHVHEHFILCCILEYLLCYDQLQVCNLLGCEVLARRLQLLESAYEMSSDKKSPDFFHAEDFMGLGEKASGAAISSVAEREAAERLAARALVQKEIRKAKENGKAPKKTAPGGGKVD